MKKKVLVLTGSVNDLFARGEATPITKEMKIKAVELGIQLEFHSCSADRTPYLLPAILAKSDFDGILYHGGYSLVLGAGLQETLLSMRYHKNVKDYSKEIEEYYRNEDLTKLYYPGLYKPELVKEIPSPFYQTRNYIPSVCVPGKDTPSGGLSSFLSVSESPTLCEPRPVVGVNEGAWGLECLVRLMNSQSEFQILDSNGANKLQNLLKDWWEEEVPVVSKEELKASPFKTVLYMGEAFNVEELKSIESLVNLLLYVPAKMALNEDFFHYIEGLHGLSKTLVSGVGNHFAPAMLASYLKGETAKMWQSRQEKTMDSVLKGLPENL